MFTMWYFDSAEAQNQEGSDGWAHIKEQVLQGEDCSILLKLIYFFQIWYAGFSDLFLKFFKTLL